MEDDKLESIDIDTIISLGGFIFVGTGLFFTARSFRQNANSQYLQVINQLHTEITTLLSSQERNNAYEVFGVKYLNLHDRIAYLAIKKIIPHDMARFFDTFFAGALSLLEKDIFRKYEKDMTNLKYWCEAKQIKPGTAPEPHPLSKEKLYQGSPIKHSGEQLGR